MKIEFIPFNGVDHWGWVKQRLNLLQIQDTCGIMAFDIEGKKIVGAAIYDTILYNSAQATLILDSPMVLRSGFLKELMGFVFYFLDKEYMYTTIAEDNWKSLRFAKRVGFLEKMRLREGFTKGIDLIVHELSRKSYEEFSQRGLKNGLA